MEVYTALGVRVHSREFNVESNGMEVALNDLESAVWSFLLWNFCDEEGILDAMRQNGYGLSNARFDSLLNQMLEKRVVAVGSGVSVEEAVVQMLLEVRVEPISIKLTSRVIQFAIGFLGGMSTNRLKSLFVGTFLNGRDKRFLSRLQESGTLSANLEEIYGEIRERAGLCGTDGERLRRAVENDYMAAVIRLVYKHRIRLDLA